MPRSECLEEISSSLVGLPSPPTTGPEPSAACTPRTLAHGRPFFVADRVFLLCALLLAFRCLLVWFRRGLLSRLCSASRTVRVCVASLLLACAAFLLQLTELAKPAQTRCACCNTHQGNSPSWPSRPRCGVSVATHEGGHTDWDTTGDPHTPAFDLPRRLCRAIAGRDVAERGPGRRVHYRPCRRRRQAAVALDERAPCSGGRERRRFI